MPRLFIVFIVILLIMTSAMAETKIIELLDIQGIYGGRNIVIYSSGKTLVTSVRPPEKGDKLVKKEYVLTLDKAALKEIIDTFTKNDFINLKIKDRPGIPDEARVTISITDAKGKKHTISAWERNTMLPDEYMKSPKRKFDNVYAKLKALENKALGSK